MINARQLPHHSISLHIKGLIGYSTRSVDSSRQPQRVMGGQTVEFYYDISCPFAYIASTRIEALAARTGANVLWRPVLLGAIYRATNAPQGAAGSASDVFNPTKKQITGLAFQRTIKRLGIPYSEPPQHPVKTTAPLRLLYHASETQRPELSKALFRAYWVEGQNVSSTATLIDVIRRSKIPGADALVKAVDSGSFEGEVERKQLEESTDLAVQRGTPGVPGFWVPHEQWVDRDGKHRSGRLYWGQDRMQFLEAVLLANGDGKNFSSISKPLRSLEPRCVRQGIPYMEETKLEFWYDFSSPWAFLGWTQLERMKRQFGDRLTIEMKPFLLGILFREIGAPNLPMAAISEQKRKYSQLDHTDWVRWWNQVNKQEGSPDKNIDFHWADIFPIRTPTVLRAVLVEPKLVGPLFRGCWEQNLDMGNEEVLKGVIDKAGYSSSDILAKANSAEIKTELRERTKEAKDTGINGVPSYRIFRRRLGDKSWRQEGDIVWGQDLIGDVEDYIAGWDGTNTAKIGEDEPVALPSKL